MLFLRLVVLLMLGGGLVCFVIYALTADLRYRTVGVRLVKWTVVAGLVFFSVLAAERLAG